MAEVVTPSSFEVVSRTGLSELITGATEQAFLEELESLIPSARAECVLAVGRARFTGTLEDEEALLLADAICFRTAARALNVPWLQKVTGTHEPLLMEEAADIAAVREGFRAEAERLEGLATSGVETSEDRPFARPSIGSGTFTRSSSDRSPSERNALVDERDDISSFDTDAG